MLPLLWVGTSMHCNNPRSEKYDTFNAYKRQKIMETDFDFIDICIKNQDNKNIELKDFWEISLYINKIKL